MIEEQITEKIKRLGFTAYEAKAYLTLLKISPATRYELSKNSGVPRSAIYDIIRKLEKIGAVNATYTQPERYVPLPPEQLFALLERQFTERIEDARESLENYNTQIEPGHLWNIVGYENMIHKAREMIGRAKKSIFISVWARECQHLLPQIEDAIQRKVHVLAFSFTPLRISSKNVYSYQIPDEELAQIWDRKIILVIDKTELLMGEADDKLNKKTAWTDNKAIVDIATNHMILDITLYGIRKKVDVSKTVTSMESSGFKNLGIMLNDYSSDEYEILANGNSHTNKES